MQSFCDNVITKYPFYVTPPVACSHPHCQAIDLDCFSKEVVPERRLCILPPFYSNLLRLQEVSVLTSTDIVLRTPFYEGKRIVRKNGNIHPLVKSSTLELANQVISGKNCLRKEHEREIQILVLLQDEKAQLQINICPGKNMLAGVGKSKLIRYKSQ